jgi:L-rhamnose mutarotase
VRILMKPVAVMILGVLFGACATRAPAFSPYEQSIAVSKTTRVGLLAAAAEGKEADLDKAIRSLCCEKGARALGKAGISNLSVCKKVLTDKKTWYWAYFDYRGQDYLKAVNAFEKAANVPAGLIDAHPRAKTYGTSWLQMEWINYLRGSTDQKTPTKKTVNVVTRIKPEKEEQYRTLHQTVWPGVTDQLARSNNRNLSVFLAEMGDEIYEFLYVEYIGTDAAADDKASKSDPATLRWWKLTDACQLPLPDVKEGIWAGMEAVVP